MPCGKCRGTEEKYRVPALKLFSINLGRQASESWFTVTVWGMVVDISKPMRCMNTGGASKAD